MEAEGVALGLREGGAFVEQWIIDEVHAAAEGATPRGLRPVRSSTTHVGRHGTNTDLTQPSSLCLNME